MLVCACVRARERVCVCVCYPALRDVCVVCGRVIDRALSAMARSCSSGFPTIQFKRSLAPAHHSEGLHKPVSLSVVKIIYSMHTVIKVMYW